MACQEACGCCKGACCYEAGGVAVCEQQTCKDCELLGGKFQGVGTACNAGDCPCDPPADHLACEKCEENTVINRCAYGEYCCYGECQDAPCVSGLSLKAMSLPWRPYSRPTVTDTAVVMAFFRPADYKTPLNNAKVVLADLRQAGIPVFVVELLYPGQESVIPDPDLVLRASGPMFHCENLWNVMARRLPDQYQKFIFMDSDLRFTTPDWIDQCSRLLDECDVIQPMEMCDWGEMQMPSVAAMFCQKGTWGMGKAHPGFAMGIRREYWEWIGGIYDRGTLGCSDAINWACYTKVFAPLESTSIQMTPEAEARKGIPKARVGYLEGCVVRHMPHGSRKNRRYQSRYQDFVFAGGITPNADGVYEWDLWDDAETAASYFRGRAEDGGPGTELKALLSSLGFKATPKCKCAERADTMDRQGCDWCEVNIDQIDGWLAEEAKKRKLPYISLAGRTLIKLAIRRARKKGNSR